MKTNRILCIVWAGMALTACSGNEEWQTKEDSRVEVQFAGELTSASAQAGTRATTQENWGEPYLSIGISPVQITGTATSSSISQYYNVQYTTQSTGATATFTPASGAIYFQSPKETVTFSAYSPYEANLTKEGDNKGLIALTADDDYNVKDYIWAKAEGVSYTSHQASFAFSHVQSKLKIRVELDESVSLPVKADGEDEAVPTVTITQLEVSGLVTSGSFNTETGVSSPASAAPTDLVTAIATADASNAQDFQYLIIPQTVGANALVFTVTTSTGDVYKKTFTTDTQFQAGYAHNYHITAKKYDLVVTDAVILGWDEQEEVKDDAMMTAKNTRAF